MEQITVSFAQKSQNHKVVVFGCLNIKIWESEMCIKKHPRGLFLMHWLFPVQKKWEVESVLYNPILCCFSILIQSEDKMLCGAHSFVFALCLFYKILYVCSLLFHFTLLKSVLICSTPSIITLQLQSSTSERMPWSFFSEGWTSQGLQSSLQSHILQRPDCPGDLSPMYKWCQSACSVCVCIYQNPSELCSQPRLSFNIDYQIQWPLIIFETRLFHSQMVCYRLSLPSEPAIDP